MDKLSERLAVVATVDPDAYASGVQNTDYVDMADFNEALFVLMAGILASSATVDLTLRESRTTGGSGEQALTGKSITAFGTGSNDSQAVIHVRANDLSEGYRYVRGQMLLSSAGGDAAVLAVAGAPRFHPATDYDLGSVVEIVD